MTAKEHFLQVEDKQTPNPLDDSELRKKANEIFYPKHPEIKIDDGNYNLMLDFAKYYHSIQAKESKEPKEGSSCVWDIENDQWTLFKSCDDALEYAKGRGFPKHQIFKLVAEVEKVTTINVKEV